MQIAGERQTILVVDDEVGVLHLAHGMLRRMEYTAILANSAAEALRFINGWPELDVDLALIDIVMSQMDGFELAEHLHKNRPTLPVVYMSAHYDEQDLIPSPAGEVPFLLKPFTAEQLARKISAVRNQ